MDECVVYLAKGADDDKHSKDLMAHCWSVHSAHHYALFRHADCPRHGAVVTGVGSGERLFAVNKRCQLEVYSWGKEAVDQKFPLPEPLKCVAVISHPVASNIPVSGKSQYRVPWLLAGGSELGRIYIWELALGNLLCVKDAHYQPVLVLKFSPRGDYLISGGADGRVLVWNTLDLINLYGGGDNDARGVKPYFSITDHSMAINDLVIPTSSGCDLRVYTASADGTVRVYDIATKQLVTTLVLPLAVVSLAVDPAERAVYTGLQLGVIRTVPLYTVDPHTLTLVAVGGGSKIVTVADDPELSLLFVHHQQLDASEVTALEVTLDGTLIVLGDAKGRVFVADVVTRQVVKALAPLNSAISMVTVATIPIDEKLAVLAKKHRLVPQLKRVLALTDPLEHRIHMEIPTSIGEQESMDLWIERMAGDEVSFKQIGAISSSVHQVAAPSAVNQEMEKIKAAYKELEQKHEQLLEQYTKMLE